MPRNVFAIAPSTGSMPVGKCFGRRFKGCMRPVECFASCLRVFVKQTRAVTATLPLHTRDTATNDSATGDQRWTLILLGFSNRRRHGLNIMPINLNHVPIGYAEALRHIFTDGEFCTAVVGDLVVVPKEDQTSEAKMPC